MTKGSNTVYFFFNSNFSQNSLTHKSIERSYVLKFLRNLIELTKNFANQISIYFSLTLNSNSKNVNLFNNFSPDGKTTEIKITKETFDELNASIV